MKKIIVRDNGVGIDFSGDRSESSKGLAILERLVTHDLDGDLRYEPVEDGTRIVITFP